MVGQVAGDFTAVDIGVVVQHVAGGILTGLVVVQAAGLDGDDGVIGGDRVVVLRRGSTR